MQKRHGFSSSTSGGVLIKIIIYMVLLHISLFVSNSYAGISCLDSVGEAVIVNGDVSSAKTEAIARAKWAAVEQAVGVEIKSQSIVQNMQMVDEAISRKANGVVTKFSVLRVTNGQDTVNVKVNVCVEPTKAKDAIAGLALNSSIAVFIPARQPKVINETDVVISTRNGGKEKHNLTVRDEHEEANILSETLIGKLTDQGYTVVDAAPAHVVDASEIEKAMKSGNYMSLRSLMYKYISNIILIGKVDYTISTRKGTDIGYDVSIPFNNVTVRLTYRMLTKDTSGKMIILTSGSEQGNGLAGNVEDAAAEGLKDLSEKLSPVILEKLTKYIQGVTRKITVRIAGVTDVSDNLAIKDVLQNTAWVSAVEDKGLGDYIVSYPENPLYLANSLTQKGSFKIIKYSPYEIAMEYLK